MSKPSFYYLEPLNQPPSSEINNLLGRFVLDRWNPGVQGYEPEDPSRIITEEFRSEDLHFENAEMCITSVSHASTNAGVRRALMIGGSHTSEGDVVLRSARVTKRGIRNARSAFDALMDDRDVVDSVKRLMRDSGMHTVWMITAILFVDNAHIKTSVSKTSQSDAKTTVKMPIAATAGIGMRGFEIEADVSSSSRKTSGASMEANMSGRHVFAVQYWRCEHRPVDRLLDRWREQMSLRGRGIQKVSTGHRGLGDSEDEEEDEDDNWDAELEVYDHDVGDKE
ncbi:uncharacterized protein N7479_001240 [Penicillium vulpinum]|uniref:Uncharacterized protein n=1 Tax=Penicillium vulpinum TaxID=29845 RepID=A0A1V6RZ05_9EURO|nr:uncharacterized protein N7479_001240 [Penicillium vulpinum]KAJ5971322.1 hypothetical protein N7479_001240 [Penicillium vulpinum]OQE06995.1 hypothetical protein PENVUL_c015G00759 [Penicillium vulpinum]